MDNEGNYSINLPQARFMNLSHCKDVLEVENVTLRDRVNNLESANEVRELIKVDAVTQAKIKTRTESESLVTMLQNENNRLQQELAAARMENTVL